MSQPQVRPLPPYSIVMPEPDGMHMLERSIFDVDKALDHMIGWVLLRAPVVIVTDVNGLPVSSATSAAVCRLQGMWMDAVRSLVGAEVAVKAEEKVLAEITSEELSRQMKAEAEPSKNIVALDRKSTRLNSSHGYISY